MNEEETRITQKILSSLLTGNQKVHEIREYAQLSPKTLTKHLGLLSKQKLITVAKGRRGQSKPCSITDAGISWLINVPVSENLKIISKIASLIGTAKIREVYQKTNSEIFARNRRLTINHFIESSLKGVKPLQQPIDGLCFKDPIQLFRETLKKLLTLQMFLSFNNLPSNETTETLETNIDKSFILFAPRMTLWFWWEPGKFSEFEGLDNELRKLERHFLSKRINQPQAFKESHFVGLDNLDEAIFKEYLEAPNQITRREIMKRIETQVGWDVRKYIEELTKGKDELIEKYFDERERPYFVKFLKSFSNPSKK